MGEALGTVIGTFISSVIIMSIIAGIVLLAQFIFGTGLGLAIIGMSLVLTAISVLRKGSSNNHK